jgi:type IVB pilus formation R64 PilN family outer membrane protein
MRLTEHGMKHFLIAAAMAAVVALSGCASTYKAADSTIRTTGNEVNALEKNKEPFRRPTIGVVKGYWVSTDAVPETLARRLPPKFREHVRLRAVEMPLSTIMANELSRFGFNSVYSTSVAKDARVTVNFNGDLQGALNAIAAATGYRWELRDADIYWADLETRTYTISMTPGKSTYSSSVGGSLTSSISGTSTGGTTAASSGGSGSGTSAQTTTRSADVSIWKDIDAQIKSMLSKRGSMVVSEASSTVSVTDYPGTLATIENYIDALNRELTIQVVVQVDVIEVTLTDRSAHGIDWTAVSGRLGQFGASVTTATTADIFPAGVTAPALTLSYRAGASDASTALVKALETQGRVSVKTHPRVVTLNNQPATIQVGTEYGYAAASSTTTTTSVGATTAITPGVARSGLMMYLLPRVIEKDRVVMQMALSINSIRAIRRITSGGSTIEVPEIATKNFQQISRLRSGTTMVLAGFRQITGDDNSQGVTREMPWLFGSQYAADGRTDTIVLITPYVLDEKA